MTTDIDAMRAAIARDRYQFSEGCAPEDVLDALDELEAARAEIARLRGDLAHLKETTRILTQDCTIREIVAASTAAAKQEPEPATIP